QQAQLLMKYANQQLELDNPQTAVIYPEGESYAGLLERLKNQATGLGWPAPIHSAHKPGEWDMASAVRRLQAQAVELVFFLGPASALREFTERAAAARWQPYILRPGVIGGQGIFDLAADFTDRVFLAYPSLPVDHTAQGVQEFESLHARHGLDFAYSRAQISAFTAAQVMAEALKRAGRALSREHLITALEGLNEYRPGLMPAISYTSTRRIGALGGYVVALDLPNRRFGPPSKWIPLEP
ncbi:MAG: ABC transporter substrate-binding protein, partial [Gammaproteobacteria bacterium]|nr:ABC transporter substrate-binding protein [Gammaproteobacteria bacterium]